MKANCNANNSCFSEPMNLKAVVPALMSEQDGGEAASGLSSGWFFRNLQRGLHFCFQGGAFPCNLCVFVEELAVHTITLGIQGPSQGHTALMLLEDAKQDKGFILMESATNIC